MVQL
ncbi:hypothetical protein RDI58_016825 [Solanum bulbocastanum]